MEHLSQLGAAFFDLPDGCYAVIADSEDEE
jgi:hypothetical protein